MGAAAPPGGHSLHVIVQETREQRISQYHEEAHPPVLVRHHLHMPVFDRGQGTGDRGQGTGPSEQLDVCFQGLREGSMLLVEGNTVTLMGSTRARLFTR